MLNQRHVDVSPQLSLQSVKQKISRKLTDYSVSWRSVSFTHETRAQVYFLRAVVFLLAIVYIPLILIVIYLVYLRDPYSVLVIAFSMLGLYLLGMLCAVQIIFHTNKQEDLQSIEEYV